MILFIASTWLNYQKKKFCILILYRISYDGAILLFTIHKLN